MHLWTYATQLVRHDPAGQAIVWRLARVDTASAAAFAAPEGGSVGDRARWSRAARSAADATVTEARYLIGDLRSIRGEIGTGDAARILHVVAELRADAARLRTDATRELAV